MVNKRPMTPATIVPEDYTPLLYDNFNGSYIYNYSENLYDVVLYPRFGNTYNYEKPIRPSVHSGNIQIYNRGKKVWLNVYEMIEQNELYIENMYRDIRRQKKQIRMENKK